MTISPLPLARSRTCVPRACSQPRTPTPSRSQHSCLPASLPASRGSRSSCALRLARRSRGVPPKSLARISNGRSTEMRGSPDRASLLYELGQAEALTRDPLALAHLQEALRLSDEPDVRARIADQLFGLLLFAGQWDAALDNGRLGATRARRQRSRRGDAARDDARSDGRRRPAAGGARRPRSRSTQGTRPAGRHGVTTAFGTARRSRRVAHRRHRSDRRACRARARRRSTAQRGGRRGVAPAGADRADRHRSARPSAAAGGRDPHGWLEARVGVRGFGWLVVPRLGACAARRAARRGGRPPGRVRTRCRARDDVRAAIDLQTRDRRYARATRARRHRCARRAGRASPAFEATAQGAQLLDVRARLRLLRGEVPAAIADLRRCGEILDATHLTNPIMSSWRSTLALALRVTAPEEAAQLIADELDLARAIGLPRPLGVASRAAGLLAGW